MEEGKNVLTEGEMQQIENNPIALVYLSQYNSYSEALEKTQSTIKRARALKRSLEYTNSEGENTNAITDVDGLISEMLTYKQKLKRQIKTLKELFAITTETDFDTVYALYQTK